MRTLGVSVLVAMVTGNHPAGTDQISSVRRHRAHTPRDPRRRRFAHPLLSVHERGFDPADRLQTRGGQLSSWNPSTPGWPQEHKTLRYRGVGQIVDDGREGASHGAVGAAPRGPRCSGRTGHRGSSKGSFLLRPPRLGDRSVREFLTTPPRLRRSPFRGTGQDRYRTAGTRGQGCGDPPRDADGSARLVGQ